MSNQVILQLFGGGGTKLADQRQTVVGYKGIAGARNRHMAEIQLAHSGHTASCDTADMRLTHSQDTTGVQQTYSRAGMQWTHSQRAVNNSRALAPLFMQILTCDIKKRSTPSVKIAFSK